MHYRGKNEPTICRPVILIAAVGIVQIGVILYTLTPCIGWWVFTFSLGAYTVATLVLTVAWNVAALNVLGALLFVLLVAFWLVVAANTL